MTTTTLSSGVTVTVPDTLHIAPEPRRRRGERQAETITTAQEDSLTRIRNDDVIAAVRDQLELVDAVSMIPTVTPATPAGMRRGAPERVRATQLAEISVDLEPNELAVVLVEQDGLYSWAHGDVTREPRQRGVADLRRVTFSIEVHPSSNRARRSDRRGFIRDVILRPVTAMVFKFVAGFAIGQVVKRLEAGITPGLVHIDSADPTEWLKPPNMLVLPEDRPARVLLLIHGTFSTTRGGFGGLGATTPGRKLLDAAIDGYDAVLGFDHRTLSEDPLENAEQIADALRSIDTGHGFVIDAISHSRGALVTRSLVEYVLPGTPLVANVAKAILVAGTNGGTELANTENWRVLLDLTTNLVVAASRAVAAAAPPAALVASVLSEGLSGLTIFAKALATEAINDGKAPGLAAMNPNGSFVRELNETQPNQPDPSVIDYYVIKSDFEINGFEGPQEFPAKLKRAIADALVDKLMGAANDLVVDVPSMTEIDPHHLGFVRSDLDFKSNGWVYHTNYFVQPDAIRSIRDWLQLGTDPAVLTGPEAMGRAITDLPAVIDGDITVFDAELPVGIALSAMEDSPADYAVVRRFHSPHSAVYHYAFRREEFLDTFSGGDQQITLELTGWLHESDSAPEAAPAAATEFSGAGGNAPWSRRLVVLDEGRPIGVVPHRDEITAVAIGGGGPAPPLPSGSRRGPSRGPVRNAAVEPSSGEIFFRAEMDNEIGLDTETPLIVDLSREQLLAADRPSAAAEAATVDLKKQITVHVIPRVNMKVLGAAHATVDPPSSSTSLLFKVAGTKEGPAEVAVVAEQGPVVLVKLILSPTIAKVPTATGRATANAEVAPPPKIAARHELWIEETKVIDSVTSDGDQQQVVVQTAFDVRFRSKDLDVIERDTTKAIKGDRLGYVKAMFAEIENRWVQSDADSQAFTKQLRAYGGQLFDELVPDKIQRVLWDNRDNIDTVQVFSTDPFIPWELVHLKKPDGKLPADERFLANMGLVRWLDGAAWAPERVTVRPGRAVGVVPEYPAGSGWELAETPGEYEYVDKLFGATKAATTINDLIRLIETPDQFDVLHFAGHGMAAQDDIANAGLVLEVRRDNGNWIPVSLTSTIVEQFCDMRGPGGNRPIVFLNACQVGRAGYQLTGIGGFSQAFLRGGAGVFVSSLWAVGDEPARTFTEKFYAELKRGRTVAAATRAARKKSREAGDATWLAYVVYGDPHAKIA